MILLNKQLTFDDYITLLCDKKAIRKFLDNSFKTLSIQERLQLILDYNLSSNTSLDIYYKIWDKAFKQPYILDNCNQFLNDLIHITYRRRFSNVERITQYYNYFFASFLDKVLLHLYQLELLLNNNINISPAYKQFIKQIIHYKWSDLFSKLLSGSKYYGFNSYTITIIQQIVLQLQKIHISCIIYLVDNDINNSYLDICNNLQKFKINYLTDKQLIQLINHCKYTSLLKKINKINLPIQCQSILEEKLINKQAKKLLHLMASTEKR